jgi:hypothetical protein
MTGIEYVKAFRAEAKQLASLQNAGRWYRMGVSVESAIEWANRGFLPEEASVMISHGIEDPAEIKDIEDSEIFAALVNAM